MTTQEAIAATVIEGFGIALSIYAFLRRGIATWRRLVWCILLLVPIVGPAIFFLSRPLPNNDGPGDISSPEPFQDPGDFGGHDG